MEDWRLELCQLAVHGVRELREDIVRELREGIDRDPVLAEMVRKHGQELIDGIEALRREAQGLIRAIKALADRVAPAAKAD
jgi:hypothetical protein